MKAIRIHEYGDASVLRYEDADKPNVLPNDVLIRVAAASFNPIDAKIRQGFLKDQMPRPLPFVLGWDCAGIVEEVGESVTKFKVGDEVYGYPEFARGGTYAEFVAVDESQIALKPKTLSFAESASLPMTAQAALTSLETAQLQSNQRILIHGGAGGVGTIAIQVAKAIGARVITTALARDHDFVRSLGADEAIDFMAEDYVKAVLRQTGGGGVNVVFDTIGGDTLTRSPLTLSAFGRVVSLVDIAQPQNLIEAWGKNAAYHFVFARQNRGKLDALTNLIERGLVKPVIGAAFPLARMGEAHDLLENGSTRGLRGKVVIDVSGEAGALSPGQRAAA